MALRLVATLQGLEQMRERQMGAHLRIRAERGLEVTLRLAPQFDPPAELADTVMAVADGDVEVQLTFAGDCTLGGETGGGARRFARINALSGDEFNRGIRAYYFGLAAVFWFIQPWVFVAVTTLIVGVLYRRDFRSQTLTAMRR